MVILSWHKIPKTMESAIQKRYRWLWTLIAKHQKVLRNTKWSSRIWQKKLKAHDPKSHLPLILSQLSLLSSFTCSGKKLLEANDTALWTRYPSCHKTKCKARRQTQSTDPNEVTSLFAVIITWPTARGEKSHLIAVRQYSKSALLSQSC